MNQILVEKQKNRKYKTVFIVQFYISFILIICLFFYWLNISKKEIKSEELTNLITSNAKLTTIFNRNENPYFCELVIDKINLRYFVYKDCNEELLKILPCKYGNGNLNQNGNICILGHNYFNDKFFGNIEKLQNGDEINIIDLNGNEYNYFVYEKFEIHKENKNEILKVNNKGKFLTLCTCTIDNDIRFIVRAKAY